ncbi:unnamed protein product [Larinioides sclopetarius]
MMKLLSEISKEDGEERDCSILAEASNCLAEVAKDCNGLENLEERRQVLRVLAALNCPQKDLPEEVEECVNDLESELMGCIEDGVAEVLKNLMELPEGTEVDEDDIKCQMYGSMSKCIGRKVENNCGVDASVAALAEILDDDEIRQSCKISEVEDTGIKGHFIHIGKKRRK